MNVAEMAYEKRDLIAPRELRGSAEQRHPMGKVLLPYLMTTVLAGGILALGFIARHLAVRRDGAAAPSLPYGVAIAAGGILTTGGCSVA